MTPVKLELGDYVRLAERAPKMLTDKLGDRVGIVTELAPAWDWADVHATFRVRHDVAGSSNKWAFWRDQLEWVSPLHVPFRDARGELQRVLHRLANTYRYDSRRPPCNGATTLGQWMLRYPDLTH